MAIADDERGDLADPEFRAGICNELNVLIESERAGVETLTAWRSEAAPALAEAFARIAGDQEGYAAGLAGLVRRLGGEPSEETGRFAEKAMAVDGWPARIAFFNRGQAWIVRVIEELLPDVESDAELAEFLAEMRDRHVANIEAAARLIP